MRFTESNGVRSVRVRAVFPVRYRLRVVSNFGHTVGGQAVVLRRRGDFLQRKRTISASGRSRIKERAGEAAWCGFPLSST